MTKKEGQLSAGVPQADEASGQVRIGELEEDGRRLERANRELTEDLARHQQGEVEAEQLFEVSPDALFVLDEEGRFLKANAVAIERYGYSREELLRMKPEDLAPAALRAEGAAMVRGVLAQPATFEWRHRRKDGSEVPVEIAARPFTVRGQPRVLASVRDITERKRAEDQLRERERQLSTLISNLPGAVFRVRNDPDYSVEFVSEQIADVTGFPAEDFWENRRNFGELMHPDDRDWVWDEVQKALGGNRPYELTYRFIDARGRERWNWERGRGIHDANGELQAVEGFVLDVTDRSQAEVALRESREKLTLAMRTASMGSWSCDPETGRFEADEAGMSLHGFDPGETVTRLEDGSRHIHPDDVPEIERRFAQALRTRGTYDNEYRVLLPDGGVRWVYSIGRVREGSSTLVGMVQEITERKQAETALRESRERLATMSSQLIATQESERRHLARELHDEIGQALTAIKLNLAALMPALTDRPSLLVRDALGIVDRTLQQVRDMALDLRPSMLDDIGLVAALRWCLHRQSHRASFTPHFAADSTLDRLPQDIETACFRVAQEGLTNVVRHAKARNVRVDLRHHDAHLELIVADDGIGFDVATARARATHGASMGLLGMEERVGLIGGQIDIQSAPSGGTAIRARFPLGRGSPVDGR